MPPADPGPLTGSHGATAVILGTHPFPHGNSSANRMLTMAQTFGAAGFDSVVVNDDPRLLSGDSRAPWEVVRGIGYANLGSPHNSRWARSRRRRTFATRAVTVLADRAPGVRIVVVPSNIWTPHVRRELRRAMPGAQLVVDVVERHDATQFRRGWLSSYFLRHRLTSWYASRSADRVIAVSNALASGPFAARSPLVLPPVADPDEFAGTAEEPRPVDHVRVAYFGSPGSKDDLSTVLRAIQMLSSSSRATLRFAVAGVDEGQLSELPGVSSSLVADVRDTLEVEGVLPRTALFSLLSRTHFSILVREPEAGFARFGFPSKIAESLAAGCPVIGNLTSDLDRYLVDGWNALVCDRNVADLVGALERAVAVVASGEYETMSGNARSTAVERLSPDAWATPVAHEFSG